MYIFLPARRNKFLKIVLYFLNYLDFFNIYFYNLVFIQILLFDSNKYIRYFLCRHRCSGNIDSIEYYRLRSHLYNRSQLRFFLSKKFEDGEWTSVNVVHLKCGLWSGKRSEMNRRVVQM